MTGRMDSWTCVKPSILALVGRSAVYAFSFAFAIVLSAADGVVPVRLRVHHALTNADEVINGFEDCSVEPPMGLVGHLSGASCVLEKPTGWNRPPVATILHGAEIRVLDGSRHGFRKALVAIQLSDGSVRQFRVRNIELEVVAKSLEFVPAASRADEAEE